MFLVSPLPAAVATAAAASVDAAVHLGPGASSTVRPTDASALPSRRGYPPLVAVSTPHWRSRGPRPGGTQRTDGDDAPQKGVRGYPGGGLVVDGAGAAPARGPSSGHLRARSGSAQGLHPPHARGGTRQVLRRRQRAPRAVPTHCREKVVCDGAGCGGFAAGAGGRRHHGRRHCRRHWQWMRYVDGLEMGSRDAARWRRWGEERQGVR